jgi:Flp pilus assembly pilin Flp
MEDASTWSHGQGTVEYALLIASIAVALILGMLFLAGRIENLFTGTSSRPEFRPPPVAMCDSHYSGACIPSPPPDLDCGDLDALGIHGVVRIVSSDPHGLDSDGDGIACN